MVAGLSAQGKTHAEFLLADVKCPAASLRAFGPKALYACAASSLTHLLSVYRCCGLRFLSALHTARHILNQGTACLLILLAPLQVLTWILDALFFGSWVFEERNNIIVYRIETFMCGINLLRVYLAWR